MNVDRECADSMKKGIKELAGGISNGRYIDMIYGFVSRLYMEERGNEKKKQE